MQKIKMSFIKCFPAVLIAAAVFLVVSTVFSALGHFGSLVDLIVTSPIYVGFYSFLFKRIEDENPKISTVFDFYRSGSSWWKSFCMYALGAIILLVILVILLILFAVLMVYSRADMENIVAPIGVILLLACIGRSLFRLMPYLYAKNTNIGIGEAMRKSVKFGLKYLFVFLAIYIVIGAVKMGFLLINFDFDNFETFVAQVKEYNQSVRPLSMLMKWLTSAVSMWANFTAAYIIMGREKIFDENDGVEENYDYYDTAEDTTNDEDTPFIEPYDFYIEADERFSDEKIIETENIRGVDILAVLDEMNLADDIKIDLVIRKKLKKMFEDLSFEIGEYVTYEGGREIENDFTEEIDDREFEVSVKISKGSDYEPFILDIRIDLEEE